MQLKGFTDKDAEREVKEIVSLKTDDGVLREVKTYANPSERSAFILGARFGATLQSEGVDAAMALVLPEQSESESEQSAEQSE